MSIKKSKYGRRIGRGGGKKAKLTVKLSSGCATKDEHEFLLHRKIMAVTHIMEIIIILILMWFTLEVSFAASGLVPVLGLNLIVTTFSVYTFHTTIMLIYMLTDVVYTVLLVAYVIVFNIFNANTFPSSFYLIVFGINTGLVVFANCLSGGLVLDMYKKCRKRGSRRVKTTITSNVNAYSHVIRSTHTPESERLV